MRAALPAFALMATALTTSAAPASIRKVNSSPSANAPMMRACVGMSTCERVTVAGRVDRRVRPVPPLDESAEAHRGELALSVRLIETGPQRGVLGGLGADGERVHQLEPARVGEGPQEARRTVIRVIVRSLEQPRIAIEEVEVPVDHRVTTRS